MVTNGDIAIYCGVAAYVIQAFLAVDKWAHSPAGLDVRLKKLEDTVEKGNERLSQKMSEIQTFTLNISSRVSYLEGGHDADHGTRPWTGIERRKHPR